MEIKRTVAGIGYLGGARRKGNEKLHDVWRAMLNRCYAPKSKSYKDYGAKGIGVCERWQSFSNFLEDAVTLEGWDEESYYSGKLVLDKDKHSVGNKHYSPEHCCWITRRENTILSNMNMMRPFIAVSPEGIEYEGLNVNEFARGHGLTPQRVHDCLNGKLKWTKKWTFKRRDC